MITFKNRADSADIYVYGEITKYPFENSDVSAEGFKDMLKEAAGKPLNIYINSGGGDVFEGQTIATMLERYEGRKTCYIDGICASIATKIPFACDSVNFAEGAYFMIHRASAVAWGNYDDLLKMADTLEQIDNGLVATYRRNSNMTDEVIRQKMRDETWYTSDTINDDFNFNIVAGKQIAAYVSPDTMAKYANAPKNIETAEPEESPKEDPNNLIKLEFALL